MANETAITNGVRPDDGIVDLDALVQPAKIKLHGKVFELPPMGLDTLAAFAQAARELQDFAETQTSDKPALEQLPALQKGIAELDKIFPEVGGFGTLAIPQLVRIFEVIGNMAAGTVGNPPGPVPNRATRRGSTRGGKGKRSTN